MLEGGAPDEGAVAATLRFADKAAFVGHLAGDALDDVRVQVTGDRDAAARFASYIDEPADMSRILVTLHGAAPTAPSRGEHAPRRPSGTEPR